MANRRDHITERYEDCQIARYPDGRGGALALLESQVDVRTLAPLLGRNAGVRAAKRAVRKAVYFATHDLASQMSAIGWSVVLLGTAAAERVEQLANRVGRLESSVDEVAALRQAIRRLEARVAELERAAAAGHRPVVHVKVDTGLSRNGVPEADWGPTVEALAAAQRAGAIELRGVFSHLSNTSADDDRAQVVAFERFLDAVRSVGLEPGIRHLAASAAALDHPAAHYDLVRFGIALYGIAPEPHLRGAVPLRPAMRLSARVVGVKRVPAGSGVSYGYLHRTAAPTTLALVPLGYADGAPRAAIGAPVLIGGSIHRVVGRIAMDQFVVDVGDAPVAVGDEVVLWGDPAAGEPSVDDWADAAGTIAYELVTRLGRRVRRTTRAAG